MKMKFTGVAIASILSTLTLFNLSCSNQGSATSTTASSSTEKPSSKTGDSVSGVGAKQSPCSLLTAAEVEAATGAKMADPQPADLSAQGVNSQSCTWYGTSQNAQLSLTIAPFPPGLSDLSTMDQNAGMDELRAKHWTEETKMFGKTWCFTFTPPASQKDGGFLCGCSGEVKGLILSVNFLGSTKKLSIEETKLLLDKAIARFH